MAPIPRAVIPQVPHHVQRGNNRPVCVRLPAAPPAQTRTGRQDVFFVDDDRRTYLEMLRDQCERFGLRLVGYCLMPACACRTCLRRGRDRQAQTGPTTCI